jgi:hypothetical protein
LCFIGGWDEKDAPSELHELVDRKCAAAHELFVELGGGFGGKVLRNNSLSLFFLFLFKMGRLSHLHCHGFAAVVAGMWLLLLQCLVGLELLNSKPRDDIMARSLPMLAVAKMQECSFCSFNQHDGSKRLSSYRNWQKLIVAGVSVATCSIPVSLAKP